MLAAAATIDQQQSTKILLDDNCTNGNLTSNIIIIYIYIGVEKLSCVCGYQYGLDDLFIIKSMCP